MLNQVANFLEILSEVKDYRNKLKLYQLFRKLRRIPLKVRAISAKIIY